MFVPFFCEWIDQMVALADNHYPDDDCIRIVMGHLAPTNRLASVSSSHLTKPKSTLMDSSSTSSPKTQRSGAVPGQNDSLKESEK